MTFKPMLATECTDIQKLKFPILASHKLDGVRATMQGGVLLSRSLKPIPNKAVQEMFANVPEGIDGELIVGDPCDQDAYRKTVSVVMSEDKPAKGVNLHVFDKFDDLFGFVVRYDELLQKTCGLNSVIQLEQREIADEYQLLQFEAAALEQGHEGVMIRSLDGPYKQGRSTEKEGFLLKLKRFKHSEAIILGAEEKMHNGNEARTNELGHTERSSHKANLSGTGELGALLVRDITTEVEFAIGSGYTAAMRKKYWERRSSLSGLIVRYTYFPTGSKDKPRFPVFDGFRDERDM